MSSADCGKNGAEEGWFPGEILRICRKNGKYTGNTGEKVKNIAFNYFLPRKGKQGLHKKRELCYSIFCIGIEISGGEAMKRVTRKILLLPVCLVLVLALGGCSLETSVENLFTLPEVPVEYTGLANTLNAYLKNGYEYTAPTGGTNLQSLQMIDLDGDGHKEAVAFFRCSADENPLKILIFRAEGEAFALQCTIESGGTSIDSVSFRDFDGDGKLEVAVGWRISAEVQTVAVYRLRGSSAETLMQNGYSRFIVDDLDSDGLFDLLLFRTDADGSTLAEHFRWTEGELRSRGECRLSCTAAELNRGSIVCGKLDSQNNAAFVTGVDEGDQAMTDILVSRDGELKNVALSRTTGASEVRYSFCQLRPQDINNDGIIEIPYPADSTVRSAGRVFFWYRFNGRGDSIWVMDTYHNLPDGWYLALNEDWHGCLRGTSLTNTEKGTCVTLQVNGETVLYLYSFSGEDRERDARSDGRTLLMQRTNVAYAMRITEEGEAIGVSNEWVNSHFYLISTAWTDGN